MSESEPACKSEPASSPGRPALLEVCTESAAGARAAAEGGAGRIELCADLDQDGLTPSPELFAAARAGCGLPIMAMVRPRPGDFVLRPGELELMERQVDEQLERGAAGVVLGCLTERGEVDADSLRRLVARAGTAPVTFHRAFDEVGDRSAALEALIGAGVARVLTSGGAATALEGAPELARLVKQARGRIGILPGGGVRAHNAAELVRLTGVAEVHSAVGGLDGPEAAERVARLVAALA